MAKVNYGTIVNDARGKVNGTVFSKNKSGAYTRRKVTPANPNTTAQSTVRTNFASLSQAWSGTLTEPERGAWLSFANTYPRNDVFGASIKISGLNMFISLNQVLLNLGMAYELNPPATNVVAPVPFDPTSLAVVTTAPSITFSQTAVSPAASTLLYVFGAGPLPPGRQPANSLFRFIEAVPNYAGSFPHAVDVTASYIAKFGSWLGGQRISLLVASVDTNSGLVTVGAKMSALSA